MIRQTTEAVRGMIQALSPEAAFDDTEHLFEAGVLQSMQTVELVVALMDTFGVDVTAADLFEDRLGTVDAIVALILERQGSQLSA
jgi:acyl carrier protein